MKFTVTTPVEIDIDHVVIDVPVNGGDEEMPFDFPGRVGNYWAVLVDIATGQIAQWPQGTPACHLYMKVVDTGCYALYSADSDIPLADLDEEPVPHGVIPGEYGDYIDLHIDENGVVTNWPKKPDVSEFFK